MKKMRTRYYKSAIIAKFKKIVIASNVGQEQLELSTLLVGM